MLLLLLLLLLLPLCDRGREWFHHGTHFIHNRLSFVLLSRDAESLTCMEDVIDDFAARQTSPMRGKSASMQRDVT